MKPSVNSLRQKLLPMSTLRCVMNVSKATKGYIANLKELREVKQREKAEEHKDELRVLLASMDDEERTKFINSLNRMSMDTQN